MPLNFSRSLAQFHPLSVPITIVYKHFLCVFLYYQSEILLIIDPWPCESSAVDPLRVARHSAASSFN